MASLIIFDFCQTIGMGICLFITIPIASFVYFKLLFISPFAENYTFKLIVVNGMTSLITALSYLIFAQLATYPFMFDFYVFLTDNNLVTAVGLINTFFGEISLYSAFFVALNRLKTMMFLRLKGNDSIFFIISMISSLILSLPATIDLCTFTTMSYIPAHFNGTSIMFPSSSTTNQSLRTISNIISIIASLATLIVNIILIVLLMKERKFLEKTLNLKFKAERGLIVTSIVSYVFYMLYFINNSLARYSTVWFSAVVQWLFLSLSSITPFWCLIFFTPSIRRMALNKTDEVVVSVATKSTTW